MQRFKIAYLISLSVVACSPVLATTSATQADGASVQQALASHDYRRAQMEFDALVTRRLPVADNSGPDPVMDRLLSEVIALNGSADSIITLLQRVISDPKLRNRGHYQFLLATAYESVGQLGEAERLYQVVMTNQSASLEDRTGATIGYARLRMMTNPDEAIAVLQAMKSSRAYAWELHLQRSRAETLAGREEAAEVALQQAWNDASLAEADQSAVARTASDMMVAAGRRGDRGRMIALLAVDRLNRNPNATQDVLSAGLPICGSAGIRIDDKVAIQFVRQAAPGRPRFSLIWASRTGVAAPFFEAVGRNPGFLVPDGQATTVILKCRLAPTADYQVKANLDDQILSWTTGRGSYPLLAVEDGSDTSSLASMLAERERRYGSKSIMLLPVLVRVLQSMTANGLESQDGRIRAAALSHRIADLLAVNKAPADIVLLSALSATALDVVAQTKSPTIAQAEFQELLRRAAGSSGVSLDVLYMFVSGATAIPQAPTAVRARLLEQALAVLRAREKINDPRVSALALRLIAVRRDQGDGAAVIDLIEKHGLATDMCSVSVQPVRFTSSGITTDDYPTDLVQTLMQGRTIMEFNVNAAGTATEPRILVSDPPFVFDDVAIRKSSTFIYEPAKSVGVARGCKAQQQSITWRLPY